MQDTSFDSLQTLVVLNYTIMCSKFISNFHILFANAYLFVMYLMPVTFIPIFSSSLILIILSMKS